MLYILDYINNEKKFLKSNPVEYSQVYTSSSFLHTAYIYYHVVF